MESLLLVEGESDRGFFEQLCKQLQIDAKVQVVPPKGIGGDRNTKQGVFNRLELLLNQLVDSEAKLKKLAVIVDADYPSISPPDGYQNTVKKIEQFVNPFGFSLINQENNNGLIFQNDSSDISDFGLWVMPNNGDDGMLEDFIKRCINSNEQPLFNHAQTTVSQLPSPKFKAHHCSKAEIATWLAWQKVPSHGLYIPIKDSLLDENNPLFEKLKNWLVHVFK